MQICIEFKRKDMHATFLLITTNSNSSMGYIIGAVIAIFILGYLLFSLVKPEKF
jgi:K+-transporting ATPase KdpF subunit